MDDAVSPIVIELAVIILTGGMSSLYFWRGLSMLTMVFRLSSS